MTTDPVDLRTKIALEIWHRWADTSVESFEDETHKEEYLQCADAILALSPLPARDDRGSGCIICANGNDLPDGEHCRACGREGLAFGLGAAVIKARGRNEPPRTPVNFARDDRGEPVAWREVSDADWHRAVNMADEILQHDLSKKPLGLSSDERRVFLDNAMQHAFGSLSLRALPPVDRDAVAAEREACAKIAENIATSDREYAMKYPDEGNRYIMRAHRATLIAAAIRNREGDDA